MQRFYTVLGILKSPNQSLRKICDNEDKYMVSSVILLILASVFSIDMASGPLDENITSVKQFGVWVSDDPVYWIISSVFGLLGGIALIAIIFMIGKKLGGIGSFKKIFTVMSHATLPVIIGGIIISAIFFVLSSTVSDNIDEADPKFQHFGLVSYLGVMVPLSIWSLIISIKALKIANGFGTGRAFGIILLASLAFLVILIPLNWVPI